MKIWRRILALSLSLFLALTMFPAAAFAAGADNAQPQPSAEELDALLPAGTEEPEEEEDEGDSAVSAAEQEEPLAASDADVPAAPAADPLEDDGAEDPAGEPEAGTATGEAAAYAGEPDAEECCVEFFPDALIRQLVPGAGENDGDLLNGYAQQRLDSLRPARADGRKRAPHNPAAGLEGLNLNLYNKLKAKITAVAAGSEDLTNFSVPAAELGLSRGTGENPWRASDLGLTTLGTDKQLSQEAMNAAMAQLDYSMDRVLNCLLAACPYELYWFDKTTGLFSGPGIGYTYNASSGEVTSVYITAMNVTMAVSQGYSDGRYVEKTVNGNPVHVYVGVNRSYAARIQTALTNAEAIVQAAEGSPDADRLRAYKDGICSRVLYDENAQGGGVPYGDPWQIISVFDGDSGTNVVCEGYSKAFQYLCDLTDFRDSSVQTICVTGQMQGATGSGPHMWNLVRMPDGKNYLVDVTNCDAGSVGYPDLLFLAGYDSGSLSSGYNVLAGSASISYVYDDTTRSVFSDSELTLSDTDYSESSARIPGIVETAEELAEDLANGVTAIRYMGTGVFTVDRDVSIPNGVTFTLTDGTLRVAQGVTMTIEAVNDPDSVSVVAKDSEILGTLSVYGKLRLTAPSAPLSVTGRITVASGGVYVKDPAFRRDSATMQYTGSGRYYVEYTGVGTESTLRAAAANAATSTDKGLLFRILPSAAVTVTQDLTLGTNVRMVIESGASVTPAAGVTLTNDGIVTIYQSFTAPGRIVNNNCVTLAKNVRGSFSGGYTGTGYLRISRSVEDPYSQVIGLPRSAFTDPTPVGSDGYWNLRLRQLVLSYDANGGDGAPAAQTGVYGTTLLLSETAPTRSGHRFLGWATASDAAEAEHTPGDSFLLEADVTLCAVWTRGFEVSFKRSCSFGNNLSINYYIPEAALEGYENCRLHIEKQRFNADGSDCSWESFELSSCTDSAVNGEACKRFVFSGISAKEMSDEIHVTVLADRDGETFSSNADVYSVRKYAMNRLAASEDGNFKRLLVDMLNYGAQAQRYFGYNTSHPANDGLTAEQRALGTAELPTLSSVSEVVTTQGATAHFVGRSIVFNSNVEMKFYMHFDTGAPADSVRLVVRYTAIDNSQHTETIPASRFGYDSARDAYTGKITTIAAKDMGCTVTAEIYDGDTKIGDVQIYSIESYVVNRLANSGDETFKALVAELIKYGRSAENYFRTRS